MRSALLPKGAIAFGEFAERALPRVEAHTQALFTATAILVAMLLVLLSVALVHAEAGQGRYADVGRLARMFAEISKDRVQGMPFFFHFLHQLRTRMRSCTERGCVYRHSEVSYFSVLPRALNTKCGRNLM